MAAVHAGASQDCTGVTVQQSLTVCKLDVRLKPD